MFESLLSARLSHIEVMPRDALSSPGGGSLIPLAGAETGCRRRRARSFAIAERRELEEVVFSRLLCEAGGLRAPT
eukprot:16441047-Heterocapsa_arctica.AAC.1